MSQCGWLGDRCRPRPFPDLPPARRRRNPVGVPGGRHAPVGGRLTDRAIVIVYTTRYRKGGSQFPVVANTLAREKRESGFDGEIISSAVENKREVLRVFADVKSKGKLIVEFHFVGHS